MAPELKMGGLFSASTLINFEEKSCPAELGHTVF